MIMESKEFRTVLGEGIGVASMCWDEIPKGVFDSTRAQSVLEEILAYHDRDISRKAEEIARLRKCLELAEGALKSVLREVPSTARGFWPGSGDCIVQVRDALSDIARVRSGK